MARRLLALCVLAGLFWYARADDPPANKDDAAPAVKKEDLALKQEINARKFREFQQALLRLAQRLENSPKPEDRERAGSIRKAIELASISAVDTKFDRLIAVLKTNKDLNLDEINEAMGQSKMLVSDIRAILALLLSDNRDERRKEEMLRLQELIKQLESAIRAEKLVRAHTEAGRMEKKDLAGQERKNRQQVAKIERAMDGKNAKDNDKAGKSQGKKGEGQGKKGDGKSGEGEGKKSDGKKGDGKSDSKAKGQSQGESGKKKDGDKQEGDQGDKPQQSGEPTPGKQQIQDAQKFQKKAEDEIDKEQKEKASQQQSKAIEELEKARKKLEEILRQLREEEIERILAALQQRCEQMLQLQIAVYNGTQQVDKAFGPNPEKDSESNRGNVQKAIDLSKREGQIVEIATKAIQILEAEGSAVAFPEVFHQVRDDMRHVERRLGVADVGRVTQVIEEDIINTLKDMIEALKKAQADSQARRSQGGGGGRQDQKLIDLIQELKMIRSMQVRVNSRTKTYGEQYTGEQAAVPDILKELNDLAQRQFKIYEVTNNIARGKNK